MKNIEKYNETKCALDAYNSLVFKKVPFDEWLEREYEEPPKPTLLEAAEAVIKEWRPGYGCDIDLDSLEGCMRRLSEAVECEKKKKKKSIRNFDRYNTADDAYEGFDKFCFKSKTCLECRYRYRYPICRFAWLYDEAEKEEEKK